MKVFVTGVSGQLGYDVCRELEARGIEYKGVSSREMNITDASAVETVIKDYAPDAVIHCAAYTKVDQAEDEPELCWAVNVDGTRNIAKVCRDINAKMIYISTDYVFPGNGTEPYEVDDPVNPISVYGASKYAGELAVKSLLKEYFIIRTSWVFGANGGNFVKTMLRVGRTYDTVRVVNDQIGTPTYTPDLARLLCDMIMTDKYGIYHATNEGGFISWYDFACEIYKQAGLSTKVVPVSTTEYGLSKAKRPGNSRLNKHLLSDLGFDTLPNWKHALIDFLSQIK